MVAQMPFQPPAPGAPPIAPPTPQPASPSPAGLGGGIDVMAGIEDILAPEYEPVYPNGYVIPRKPERKTILKRADSAKNAAEPWLANITDTFNRLRGHTAGYLTYEQQHKRTLPGQPSPYKSTQIIDQMNRFRAYGASLPIAYSIEEYDPEKMQDAQKVEDFAYQLRKMHERRWIERGNMPLAQSEWHDLLVYGTIVSRRTCNLVDNRCPIEATLQDPATIFPVIGRVGGVATLNAVYQISKTTIYEVMANYYPDSREEMPKKLRDAVGDIYGDFDESSMIDVVDYNDDWWRGVFVLGTDVDIMPITAHKYGRVPYVIRYGPGGESLHVKSPDGSATNNYFMQSGSSRDMERVFKSRGFIDQMKSLHDYREGWGDLIQRRVLRDFNPPIVFKQSPEAEQMMGDPEWSNEPGAINKIVGGMEDVAPWPEAPIASGAMSMLMSFVQSDTMTNMLAPGFGQPIDKSNVSGTAQSIQAEQGREVESGWVETMQGYHAACADHDVSLQRNFGHDAQYGDDGSYKKFYVKRRQPVGMEPTTFELTPDVIDNVDCPFSVKMASLRMSELIPFGQAAQMFGPDGIGVWDIYDIAEKMGITDVDRALQNNRIYRSVRKMEELPEWAKVSIPQALKEQIRAAKGNPQLQADLLEQLVDWKKLIADPQRMQLEASAQPQPPTGPGGPPMPGQGISGGQGAPYAAMGQGPGSQGGQVGAPSGPPPPPPGSVQVV